MVNYHVTFYGWHKIAADELSPSMVTLLRGLDDGTIKTHSLIRRAEELGLIIAY